MKSWTHFAIVFNVAMSLAAAPAAYADSAVLQSGVVQPSGVLSVDLPSVVPVSSRISLSQAVQSGLKDNPQATVSRYSVVSAHENYNSQKSPINPTVQYGALNNTVAPATIGDGLAQLSNYTAYATLETNGAQRFRSAQSREQYHQAQFDAKSSNQSLKLSIIDAYVNLQVANRTLEVETKVFENMRQLSELTQKRFEIGAGTQADAIRARISYVQEQQNMISDVAGVNTARAALNIQLGRPADAAIDVSSPLDYSATRVPDLKEVTAFAYKNRPEIQSAEASLKSLKAATGLARSAYYPDVIVGKDFTASGEVNVGFSVPLDLGSIGGAVRKARADVKAQQAQVEVARQSVDLDVKSSHIGLVSAVCQMSTYDTGILKQSETLYTQMRASYLLGASSLVDVITAENTYRAVQSAYYSAVGAYMQALYTMEHAMGAPLEAAPGETLLAQTTPAKAVR